MPGTLSRFVITTNRPMARYAKAMNGTMYWVTLAMRFTPPKMTKPDTIAMITPTMARKLKESCPKEVPSESAMALVWKAL